MSITNPANPMSPVNPVNPANPVNVNRQEHDHRSYRTEVRHHHTYDSNTSHIIGGGLMIIFVLAIIAIFNRW